MTLIRDCQGILLHLERGEGGWSKCFWLASLEHLLLLPLITLNLLFPSWVVDALYAFMFLCFRLISESQLSSCFYLRLYGQEFQLTSVFFMKDWLILGLVLFVNKICLCLLSLVMITSRFRSEPNSTVFIYEPCSIDFHPYFFFQQFVTHASHNKSSYLTF